MPVCFLKFFFFFQWWKNIHLGSIPQPWWARAIKGRENCIQVKAPRGAPTLSKLEGSQGTRCQAHLLILRAHKTLNAHKNSQNLVHTNSQNLVFQLGHKDSSKSSWRPGTGGCTRAEIIRKNKTWEGGDTTRGILPGAATPHPAWARRSLHGALRTSQLEKSCVISPKAKLISNFSNELGGLCVCESCQAGSAVSRVRYPDPWRPRNSSKVPAEGKWAKEASYRCKESTHSLKGFVSTKILKKVLVC